MGGGSSGSWSRLGDIRSLEEKAKAALQGGKRNVFISFAREDMNEVNLLRAHAKNENSDIEFNDHSVREPYDSDRAAYIKQKISERIARSSVTVVYISEATAQSQWVKWEVEKSIGSKRLSRSLNSSLLPRTVAIKTTTRLINPSINPIV